MKMLNALEGFKRADARGADARAARRPVGILLRVLYPVVPAHHAGAVAASSATPPSSATCSTRRGRRSTRPRWCRTRSSWCCRSTASCAARSRCRPTADKAAIEAAALASPEFAKFAEGAAGEEGRSSCRAGWSTSSSDADATIAPPRRCRSLPAPRARPAAASSCAGAPELPLSHHRSCVGFAPRSPLAAELQRSIDAERHARAWSSAGAGRRWCSRRSPTRASKSVGRVDRRRPGARVRSCALRLRFRAAHAGRPRADPGHRDLLLTRDMSYSETRGAGQGAGRGAAATARCRPTSWRR